MSNGFSGNGKNVAEARGHAAFDYGRSAEPLPELHIFSRLSELDAEYAAELASRRARQETLEREITELAVRLSSPLENAASTKTKKRRFFGRREA